VTGPDHGFDGPSYQARFDALAAQGVDVHGEADLVRSYAPTSVLDAGCGTGRVAIELSCHAVKVTGVDVDRSMIDEARRRAPQLEWILSDLSTLELGRTFDVVLLAGNVPLFCAPAARNDLVAACAAHVAAGGRLVAGFELARGYGLDEYDAACRDAGLHLAGRWSTWDRRALQERDRYAVSVHER